MGIILTSTGSVIEHLDLAYMNKGHLCYLLGYDGAREPRLRIG